MNKQSNKQHSAAFMLSAICEKYDLKRVSHMGTQMPTKCHKSNRRVHLGRLTFSCSPFP